MNQKCEKIMNQMKSIRNQVAIIKSNNSKNKYVFSYKYLNKIMIFKNLIA